MGFCTIYFQIFTNEENISIKENKREGKDSSLCQDSNRLFVVSSLLLMVILLLSMDDLWC